MNCRANAGACGSGVNYSTASGEVVADPRSGGGSDASEENTESVEVIHVDTEAGTRTPAGYDCVPAGTTDPAVVDNGEPVQIVVTREDFARMPIAPLVATAGPPGGWVPVNMVNVLYADPEVQEVQTAILGVPVQVRASPVAYHWDLGDGNTIDTDKPGEPYPSEQVSSEYTYEGWYDITLTTTFVGEYSVNGGEWREIEGTVEVASEPIEIFAKSFESRLVNPEVPVDEEEDPYVPERTPDTEGPQDPEARHREI